MQRTNFSYDTNPYYGHVFSLRRGPFGGGAILRRQLQQLQHAAHRLRSDSGVVQLQQQGAMLGKKLVLSARFISNRSPQAGLWTTKAARQT